MQKTGVGQQTFSQTGTKITKDRHRSGEGWLRNTELKCPVYFSRTEVVD